MSVCIKALQRRAEDGAVGPRCSVCACLAMGEGRNGVWAAEQGWDVHAFDLSARRECPHPTTGTAPEGSV